LAEEYVLELHNADLLEMFADLAAEYEDQYPGRKVIIKQYFETKK
jgi:hypothetical protein